MTDSFKGFTETVEALALQKSVIGKYTYMYRDGLALFVVDHFYQSTLTRGS